MEFDCEECTKSFATKKYLARHVKFMHQAKELTHRYICNACGKTFKFQDKLDVHYITHTGLKPHKCEVCGKAFTALYSLKSHLLIHTNEKPYKCAFCEYACRDNSTLRKHQHRHMGLNKLFTCNQCDKRYDNKWRLKIHIAETHLLIDVKTHKCKKCSKAFNSNATLRMHMRRVHEEKQRVKCEICKRYLYKYNLKVHLASHSDVKPYKCDYEKCEKRFKTMGDLAKHAKIHDVSNYYECANCSHSFSRKHRLLSHLKQHEISVHRYRCEHCEADFALERYLVIHRRKKHRNERNRECKICNRTFKEERHLKIHNTRMHNMKSGTSIPDLEVTVDIKEEPLDIEEHDLEDILRRAEECHIEDIQINEHSEVIMEEDSNTKNNNKLVHLKDLSRDIVNGFCTESYYCEVVKDKDKKKTNVIDKKLLDKKQTDIKQQIDRARQREQVQLFERARQQYNDRLKKRIEIEKKLEANKPKSNVRKVIISKDESEESQQGSSNTEHGDTIEGNCKEIENKANGKSTLDDENQSSTKDDGNSTLKAKGKALKIKFNTHQCYVCFSLFETKEKLIDHCETHFDICNSTILKKCPLCPYVTTKYLTRHIYKKHGIHLRANSLSLIKKGDFYSIKANSNSDINEIDVVPSVKLLNKKKSVEIDTKKRLLKRSSTLKSVLVKSGEKCFVKNSYYKIDFSKYILGELKLKRTKFDIDFDDYVNVLVKLKEVVKKNGKKMLAPCDLCEKICLNIAALKAHRASHKKRKVARKRKSAPKAKKRKYQIAIRQPQNSMSVEKLGEIKTFFDTNIGGTAEEFDQFVSIYGTVDRVKDKDFGLVQSKFGVASNVENPSGSVAREKIVKKRLRKTKCNKYVRVIRISKESYVNRKKIINELRNKYKSVS